MAVHDNFDVRYVQNSSSAYIHISKQAFDAKVMHSMLVTITTR